MAMIKYFSQLHTADEGASNPQMERESPGFTEDNELHALDEMETSPTEDNEDPDTSEGLDDSAKDTVKFNMWVEKTSKDKGYTVEVVPSGSNRATKILIDDTTDIITQKDAIKLAVALEENNMGWQLMDDPIVKSSGAWTIKMSKAGE